MCVYCSVCICAKGPRKSAVNMACYGISPTAMCVFTQHSGAMHASHLPKRPEDMDVIGLCHVPDGSVCKVTGVGIIV